MNTFYQFANKLASISEEEFEHFKPHLAPKNYKANTIICNIGDIHIFSLEKITDMMIQVEKIKFTAYPNPFENEITIAFELQEAAEVELTVYNTLGLKVATLLQGEKQIGQHSVTYANNNASLLYVLKLRIGNQVYYKQITKF